MTTNRWPEPRPALHIPSAVPSLHALPWHGQLSPELPLEVVWLIGWPGDAPDPPRELELGLDLRWGRVGCTRRFELGLDLLDKPARTRRARAVYTFHPTDRVALSRLITLSRQEWWHLVLTQGRTPLRVLELANTLNLTELLREVWHNGP